MRKRNAPFIRPTAVKRLEILLDSLLKELEDTLSQPISLLLQLVATWRLAKKQNPSFVVPTIAHMIPSVTQLALAALARAHVRRSARALRLVLLSYEGGGGASTIMLLISKRKRIVCWFLVRNVRFYELGRSRFFAGLHRDSEQSTDNH
jgi:hypothetical protein